MNIPQLVAIEWLNGQRDTAYVLEIDFDMEAVRIWPVNTTTHNIQWVRLRPDGRLFGFGGSGARLTAWRQGSRSPV